MQFESEADAKLYECSLPRARSSSVSSRDNYGMGRVRFGKVCSAIDIRDYGYVVSNIYGSACKHDSNCAHRAIATNRSVAGDPGVLRNPPFGLDLVLTTTDDRLSGTPLSG